MAVTQRSGVPTRPLRAAPQIRIGGARAFAPGHPLHAPINSRPYGSHIRLKVALLLSAHLCLSVAAPYLLLNGFGIVGVLCGAVLVGMLSADTLLAYLRGVERASRRGLTPRWQLPLRAIAVFTCLGIVGGLVLGVATPGQQALAAKPRATTPGTLALVTGNANGLAFSPDGAALAVVTPTGIALVNRASDAIVQQLRVPLPGFVADPARITIAWNVQSVAAVYRVGAASDTAGYALTVWGADSGLPRFTTPLDGAVRGLVWSPDGAMLTGYLPPASAGAFGVILRWDAATGQSQTPIFLTNAPMLAQSDALFAWSPDATRMAVINHSHTVLILDLAYINAVERFNDAQEITALAWSPGGNALAVGHGDGTVAWLDTATLKMTRVIMTQPHPVLRLSWSPDSRRVLVADDAALIVLDVATSRVLTTLDRPARQVAQMAPLPTASAVSQPSTLLGLPSTTITVATTQWSVDGAFIGARYSDGTLVSWNAIHQ